MIEYGTWTAYEMLVPQAGHVYWNVYITEDDIY